MSGDGSSPAGGVAREPRTRGRFWARSLSARFIFTVTPIFVAVFLTCIVIETWHNYETSRVEIIDRLNTLAASQSIILAESIAEKDTEHLSLMLASVISEPNLIGIAVHDAEGGVLDSFGALDSSDPDLARTISVNFTEGSEVRRVGSLTLVMTDRHLRDDIRTRLVEHTLLGIVLLIAALSASVFAHRKTVTKPLGKLVSAINESRGDALEKVDWQSDDEIGRLIAAYNEMQERLEGYERELRASRGLLEQRVQERTEDLERAREAAVEANRVKSKFLSSMSHEFRTPMNAILGFTQVLQMSPDLGANPRFKDRLDKIEDSSRNLMALLDEIMEFARLESAADDLHLEDIDTAAVIAQAVAMVAPLAEARRIAIDVAGVSGNAGAVRADMFKLRKALFHVLSNAVKYNSPGGSVDVGCARDGDHVVITVTDTGPGIPDERAGEIFEPFNRLGREAGNIEGSGIGLTVTQRIVERMLGEIEFESEEGRGTTFRIRLPAAS